MLHKNRMVKESFDTLPTAICFFDRNGLVRLMNRRMLAVSAALREGGVQSLGELRDALAHPPAGVQLRNAAAQVYRMPDGAILRFAERQVTDKNGVTFTEVTAANVSELSALHAKLKQENERLADANRRAKRLYDAMPDLVREEEILAMKMQVHDDVGHTLLSARRALRSGETLAEIQSTGAPDGEFPHGCRPAPPDGAGHSGVYLQLRAPCGRQCGVRRLRENRKLAVDRYKQRRTAQGDHTRRRRPVRPAPPCRERGRHNAD